MFGISVSDVDDRGLLKIDLKDVLEAIGQETILKYSWNAEEVESTGSASDELHLLSDTHSKISGTNLFRIANELDQVIDGKFIASSENSELPEVTIYAVDSTGFEVVSTDIQMISMLADRFEKSAFIPGLKQSANKPSASNGS